VQILPLLFISTFHSNVSRDINHTTCKTGEQGLRDFLSSWKEQVPTSVGEGHIFYTELLHSIHPHSILHLNIKVFHPGQIDCKGFKYTEKRSWPLWLKRNSCNKDDWS